MSDFSLGLAELGTGVSLDGLSKGLKDGEGLTESSSGRMGGFLKNAFSFAAGELIVKGITSVVGSFGDLVSGAMEAEQIQTQLANVLESTGGAAGVTADMVNDLAGALQKTTPIEDEANIAGENILLTFTGLHKDVFPDVVAAMDDMAVAMNNGATPSAEQLKGTALMLGKALNDPAVGMAALARNGVTFSESQKEAIKQMVKMGDTAGAQKLMLAELKKEFGGSAEAAGTTFSGQLQILKNRLGDLAEGVVGSVLPGLTLFVGFINDHIGPAIDRVEGLVSAITVGFEGGGITGAISNLLYSLDTISPIFDTLGDAVAGFGDMLSSAFSGGFSVEGIVNGLMSLRETLIGWVSAMLPQWIAALEPMAHAAIEWIANAVPGVLAALGTYIQSMVGFLAGVLPQWVAQLLQFGIKAVSWIADQLPALGDQLGQFFNTMVNWIVDNLPGWATELAKLGAQAIKWVLDALPGLAENLGTFLGKLLGWIAQTVIDVAPKLLELGGKFLTWVAEKVIPELPGVLLAIAEALWKFITATAKEAGPKLIELAQKFWKWVTDPENGPAAKINGALSEFAGKMWDKVKEIAGDAWTKAKEIGNQLVNGIVQGIKDIASTIGDALIGAISPGYAAAKQYAQIRSPSRLFAEGLGQPLVQGIAVGITEGGARVGSSLVDTLQGAHQGARSALDSIGASLGQQAAGITNAIAGTLAQASMAARSTTMLDASDPRIQRFGVGGLGGNGAGGTVNHFNQTINTSALHEPIVHDFLMMQAATPTAGV